MTGDKTPIGPPEPDDEASRFRPDPVTGLVYCCSTLGWVTPDVAFDHRWDTSRPFDDYVNERAPAWDGLAAEKARPRE